MTRLFLALILTVASYICFGQTQPVTVKGPFPFKSKIYPGTERNYWIYVPREYDASKPTCIMVVQDGIGRANDWKLVPTLDSLIALKQIPVILGIFVDHGIVPSVGTDNFPRYNRSFEYDAMGDRYSRFLLEELLPEISQSYNLSTDPNDRSIAGASSGAICAFNVAWERPDQFRRVFSTIGTYVGLRGADEFATLVRKTEPRPIRVFLEDGSNDLNIYGGDWWMSNQGMLSALTYAGYDVEHAWGDGGHSGKHGAAILPQALLWLWKDYPNPVRSHVSKDQRLNILTEGEEWKELSISGGAIDAIAVDKEGTIFFASGLKIYKVSEGKASVFAATKGKISSLSFHSDGKLYAGDITRKKIVAIDAKGVSTDVISGISAAFLATSDKGIYFTDPAGARVGFYGFKQKTVAYYPVEGTPTGVSLNAEQTFLNISVRDLVLGKSFKINDDGSLSDGQDYIYFHAAADVGISKASGMTTDNKNNLYTATPLGVQVSDQLGRVNLIFSRAGSETTDVKFGGLDFDVLYVIGNGKLYSRKVKAKGVLSWLPAVKPPKPGL